MALAASYADAQLDAARAILVGWPAVDWPAVALAYVGGLWGYALAGGLALAGAAGLAMLSLSCFREEERKKSDLTPQDLGTLAATEDTPVAWALPRVIGRKVITLVSAPPGCGKGWWLQGLARAMDDGLDFYGLPVTPMRLLWLTEEGESVTATARRFGLQPGRVEILRRDRVRGWSDWPELVRAIRKEAWRRRCRIVVFDTVRAWCPQAERTPEDANAVMTAVRQELTEPGLAAVFVHHSRKGGGEHGEGVAGTYGLVGAVDVLVELERVPGRDEARRMRVSRRYGDLDVTATLRGHRYVADRHRTAAAVAGAPPPPTLPSHLARTLTTLRGGGGPRTVEELLEAEGGTATPLGKRLAALQKLGLAVPSGRGVKGDPIRWAATPEEPRGAPTAVRDDPAYVAYLKSPVWAARRTEALQQAGGHCQRCGAPAREVHHLTYERVGAERPEDLQALCAPCHRTA
jgi:hypothetical protein